MDIQNSELYGFLINGLKKNVPPADFAANLAALSPERWQDFLELAARQRVTSLLWHHLKQKNLDKVVPEAASASLHDAYRRNTMNNLLFNGELRLLLSALQTENIPLIMLKGIMLANAVYENIGLREMNDIDVLAQPEHLNKIADILIGMGYSPLQPFCTNVAMQTRHHLPRFIKKGYAAFEIHWNLTNPDKHYHINAHGLWERAVPIQIASYQTLTLSHEDMLLHICLHTSYLHPFTFGLRPFCDIAETINHFSSTLDWQTVADRAISQKWQRGVYLVLRLAVELTGASVPDDIMRKLQPPDVSDLILETARTQIFTDKYFANTTMSAPFAQLLESRRFSDKIKIFRQRVFLPKAEIANRYSVPIRSLRIYGCYLHRFFNIIFHNIRTFKNFKKNDLCVKNLVQRIKLLDDWMD